VMDGVNVDQKFGSAGAVAVAVLLVECLDYVINTPYRVVNPTL